MQANILINNKKRLTIFAGKKIIPEFARWLKNTYIYSYLYMFMPVFLISLRNYYS